LAQRDGIVLPPCGAFLADKAGTCLRPPRHLAWRVDRREGGDATEATRIAQRDGQRAMAAHRMASDALPVLVGRKLGSDERRKLLRDVGPHPVVLRPRLLR